MLRRKTYKFPIFPGRQTDSSIQSYGASLVYQVFKQETQLVPVTGNPSFQQLYLKINMRLVSLYTLRKYFPAVAISSGTDIVARLKVTSSNWREAHELSVVKIPL